MWRPLHRLTSLTMRSIWTLRSYHPFRLEKPRSKAVLVLGSGRSGTSVLTKALNLMGVDLGEDKLLGATEINPKGYFENEFVISMHKKIGSTMKYRPGSWGYEHARDIRAYREELTEYIRKTFLWRPVWGLKDPRTNDFMKLWKAIFRDLNIEPHYVVIVRNPMDVVASSVSAWNRDELWGLRQWQLRTLFSICDTYGGKRIIVSYEELFGNPLECLRRIATALHLPWPQDEDELRRNLDLFIDRALQRSHSGENLNEFLQRPDVTQDVKDLYSLALEGVNSLEYFQSRDFHRRAKQLYRNYLDTYGPLKRRAPTREREPEPITPLVSTEGTCGPSLN